MKKLLLIFLLISTGFVAQTSLTYTTQPDGTNGVDALVDGLNSTTNYGTSTAFRSERFQSGASWYNKRSYLYFDLDTIPANAVILSAKLYLTGVNHQYANSNASYLRRVTSSWSESTLAYTPQPTNTTTDQISIATNTSATQVDSLDVKTHVQYFVDQPLINYGWVLLLQDETTNSARAKDYASSDYATSSSRPRLVVTYEIPPTISGYVSHCSATNNNNGAIYLTITDGVSPFTYSWSNGATTKDVSDLAPGAYTVTVTDANNVISKKYFFVGCINTPVTVSVQPDTYAGMDATAIGFDTPKNENYTNYESVTNFYAIRWTAGGWFLGRAYIKFDLSSIATDGLISSATLTMYGLDHNPLSRSNASYFRRVTSDWKKYSLTASNQPSNTSTDQISLAQSTSSTQDYSLDVRSHIQDMVANPSNNFGWLFRLQDETLNSQYTKMTFASSDNTTSTKRPKLEFTFIIPAPSCVLKKKLDGGVYTLSGTQLLFRFEDEYANASHNLDIKIWDSTHTDVYPTLIGYSTGLTSYYGDMRFKLDLLTSNLSPIASGVYLMEVTNEKNEKQYLKFKVQ